MRPTVADCAPPYQSRLVTSLCAGVSSVAVYQRSSLCTGAFQLQHAELQVKFLACFYRSSQMLDTDNCDLCVLFMAGLCLQRTSATRVALAGTSMVAQTTTGRPSWARRRACKRMACLARDCSAQRGALPDSALWCCSSAHMGGSLAGCHNS